MPTDEMEDAPFRHVQTAKIRHGSEYNQYRLTLTKAIRAAGLGVNAMFRYLPEEVDELGLVPALGSEGGGLHNDDRTYSVAGEGKTGAALRLQIPEEALNALDIDTDYEAAQAGELPLLDVYAGDRLLAFDKSSDRTIPTDQLPADLDVAGDIKGKGEEVILEQIQTTTPRMRTGEVVTVAITPAIKRTGGGVKGVEYLPDLDDALGTLVPAVAREYGDARGGGDARSIDYEGPNKQVLSVPLPENVLAGLDLSVADYKDAALAERPPLAVYAGDGLIAFGRPGERAVAVHRDDTPAERAPTLTDLDGIEPALADRLAAAGYESAKNLRNITREDLMEFESLGERQADRIMADIANRLGGD